MPIRHTVWHVENAIVLGREGDSWCSAIVGCFVLVYGELGPGQAISHCLLLLPGPLLCAGTACLFPTWRSGSRSTDRCSESFAVTKPAQGRTDVAVGVPSEVYQPYCGMLQATVVQKAGAGGSWWVAENGELAGDKLQLSK